MIPSVMVMVMACSQRCDRSKDGGSGCPIINNIDHTCQRYVFAFRPVYDIPGTWYLVPGIILLIWYTWYIRVFGTWCTFCSYFLVLLVLCSRTRYAGNSLA